MNNIKWITLQANWIGYYKNVVSDELCDKIIYYSDNVKQLQKSTYSDHKGNTKIDNYVKADDGWFKNGEHRGIHLLTIKAHNRRLFPGVE